jgi:predicted transcriptional regulator
VASKKELSVFKGIEAKLNLAIMEALAKTSRQTRKQLHKQITRKKALSETYFSSLSKRLNFLLEENYVAEIKPAQASKAPVYELLAKGYLALFLNSFSMQEILDQATDAQAAQILLTLLNAILPEKG